MVVSGGAGSHTVSVVLYYLSPNVDQLKYSLMHLSQTQGRTDCWAGKLRCRNGSFYCPLPLFHLWKKKKKDFPISFTTWSSQLTESSPSPCGAAGGAEPVLAAQPENNAGGVCFMSSLYSPSRSSLEEGWEAEGARSGTGLSRCKSRRGDGTGAGGTGRTWLAGRC